jgi:hypothetical protein
VDAIVAFPFDTARYLSAKGVPTVPERLSIGLFQAATTNEDDGYLKELTQLKPPADAVP